MVLLTPQLEKKLSGTVHVPQATQCTLTEGLGSRHIFARTDAYTVLFFPVVTPLWNGLSMAAVNAPKRM